MLVLLVLVLLVLLLVLLMLVLLMLVLMLVLLGRVMVVLLLRHCARRYGQWPGLVLRICLAIGVERRVESSLNSVEGAIEIYVLVVLHVWSRRGCRWSSG